MANLPAGQVPAHLRDASYRAAARLGHGRGYRYPHDDERGWVDQPYRPDHLEGRVYYTPSGTATNRIGSPGGSATGDVRPE